jgi:hypothetical protein
MRSRFALGSAAAAIALFLVMMLCLELGRHVGLLQAARVGSASRVGVGVVDGAVYAVLALLLSFTFSGATARFDRRRQLIVDEVSAISSAWMRLDSLPVETQPGVRARFRGFVDALIASYQHTAGSDDSLREAEAMTCLQQEVWTRSLSACLGAGGEPARMLVLPSLNEMFDAVDHERLARRIHPPPLIYVMLVLAALAAALFAGYAMANTTTRNWLFHVGVAGVISTVVYIIAQIEYPRLGLVRVDGFDRALVELRATLQ